MSENCVGKVVEEEEEVVEAWFPSLSARASRFKEVEEMNRRGSSIIRTDGTSLTSPVDDVGILLLLLRVELVIIISIPVDSTSTVPTSTRILPPAIDGSNTRVPRTISTSIQVKYRTLHCTVVPLGMMYVREPPRGYWHEVWEALKVSREA